MKVMLLGVLALSLLAPVGRAQAPAGNDAPPPAARLSGMVTDVAGKPLGDVLITADRQKNTYSARSNVDGSFTITCGEPNSIYGDYLAANGDRSLVAYGQEERAKGGLPPAPLHLIAKPARTISVTVLDAHKQPLSGATVAVGAFSYQLLDRVASDAHGTATLHVPQDAPLEYVAAFKENVGLDYQLVVYKSQPRTDPYHLAPDFSAPVTLTLNGATPVKVHVTDESGQPMAGVDVNPWYFTKPDKGGELNCGLRDFDRTSDANGNATFDFIPADEQVGIAFWVRKEGYTSAQRWVWRPKDKGDLQVTLIPQIHLTGIVRDQLGRPAGSATVEVGGAGYQFDDFNGQVKTKADGTFEMNIDPELYYSMVAYRGVEAAKANFILHKDALAGPLELKLAPAEHIHGQVTAGPKKKPAPDTEVSLIVYDHSYDDLPPAVQFPGGVVNRKAIMPHFSMMTTTDKTGSYDFYAIAGDGYVECYIPPGRVMEQFKREGKPELTVNLHSETDPDAPAIFSGKVVLAGDPSKAVGRASLDSVQLEFTGMREPSGAANDDGTFTLRRSTVQIHLIAASSDGKFAGMMIVNPGDDGVTLAVGPAAKVSGRLVGPDKAPVANQQLMCSLFLEDKEKGGGISHVLQRVSTDAHGDFTFTGLIPGQEYQLESMGPDMHDGGFEDHQLATVRPVKAEAITLGELHMDASGSSQPAP
ncbi:MAG TPA: carboxypeptidase-like regulatory domain-containing protein [Phycisphaerae bacterium]|nr:carboxypeptidase-like regulatory domain-containing protein [Phycisphaerae bacterium]